MLEIDKRYKLIDGSEIMVIKFYNDYNADKKYAAVLDNNVEYICEVDELLNMVIKSNKKSSKRTTDEKIKLYRSYFRGNEDIVATSFRTKEGKMVYFPWCHIRKQLPCPKVNKPQFQCSMCNVHSFQKMTDEVIFNHLKGFNSYNKEVLYGMYPIVDRDKTYILAFDFDKKEWEKEIKVIAEVLKKVGIDYIIEISQSGNGAHVWIFFEDKILAQKARTLGHIILTEAMKAYPELSFEAFDRMFPSQNEVSNGGFGNLIALPLQGKRVVNGFSRFVDDNIEIIEDIWGTLEKTQKLSGFKVDTIIEKYQKEIPVNLYKAEHDLIKEEITLFEYEKYHSDNEIDIILDSTINIEVSNLTKKEIVKLRFLASFHNKVYYKALNQRLNTKDIPRIISLSEVNNEYIKLPRGLKHQILDLFPKANVINKQTTGKSIEATFKGELYDEQTMALEQLTQYDSGLLCAGTGFGKTVVASKLIADQSISTLIIVNNKSLAEQWKSQLEEFIDLKDEPFAEYTPKGRLKKKDKIGIIYGGKVIRSKNIDIALFQSLTSMDDLESIMNDYGMVIVDEAHHVAAKTFEDVMTKIKSRYVYGLTATPKREDGLENIIYMRIGPIRHVAEKEVPKHISQKLYLRFTSLGEHITNIHDNLIHDNNELIVKDINRNEIIINDIVQNIKEGRHIIVLSRYVEHIQVLKTKFEQENMGTKTYILNSRMKTSQLKDEMNRLKLEGKPFVLFTTGSYAGEGFDLPALDTLMLVMPIKAKGSIKQYLGRLLRNLQEKEELRVFDYVDYAIPMFYKMYLKRLKTYKQLNYEIEENLESELYRSNIIEGDYREILLKDINNAKEFMVMTTYLSVEMINCLIRISKDSHANKIVVVSEKTKDIMHKKLEVLHENGWLIKVVLHISNNFIVIDKKLVWMISNMNNDINKNDVSLRLFSEEIAKKLFI
ncbi:TOTE conflict system archaeo-eukaryotic primase domain-containing protein [Macrococcoides canis]|uniref:TOTE conflict system archaeo-eukaryotic primase domain-containing protein n=1 Tax=Macrococcoides canis TaxID=1855823 RepID=UPI001B8CE16D|nr:DEAD/DEAH box helicase family protein [Macrococcus canis]QUR94349.1 DEAD/DEAH box helicase [Macrococcus canis]